MFNSSVAAGNRSSTARIGVTLVYPIAVIVAGSGYGEVKSVAALGLSGTEILTTPAPHERLAVYLPLL
jgi:hypothetical protein